MIVGHAHRRRRGGVYEPPKWVFVALGLFLAGCVVGPLVLVFVMDR